MVLSPCPVVRHFRSPHPLCLYFFCSHHPPPRSALLCTTQQLSITRVTPLTLPDAPVVTSSFWVSHCPAGGESPKGKFGITLCHILCQTAFLRSPCSQGPIQSCPACPGLRLRKGAASSQLWGRKYAALHPREAKERTWMRWGNAAPTLPMDAPGMRLWLWSLPSSPTPGSSQECWVSQPVPSPAWPGFQGCSTQRRTGRLP